MEGYFKSNGDQIDLYPVGELLEFVRLIEVEPESYPRNATHPDLDYTVHFSNGYKWKDSGNSHLYWSGNSDLQVLEDNLKVWFAEGKIVKEV